ncbi:MAG: hypothetical protein J0H09_26675 [Burkholderiales bacterium]|nr:hypothetical protein [Burkholderiales bacterium]
MKRYADHDWFTFRALRPDRHAELALRWPAPCQVAIHLAVCVQAFVLGAKPPFAVPGMLDRPYPDLSNWTQRKTALREGLARLIDLFDDLAISASFVVEAEALDELQAFLPALRNPRHSVVAGGVHAAALHSAFEDLSAETQAVNEVLNRLRSALNVPISAWRSPSGVYSRHTLDALAASGLQAVLDFNNDELPFAVETRSGSLLALPWQHFASDLHCLFVCKQPLQDYLNDLAQGVQWLKVESARAGPRIMTLPIHPWIMAAPHRFRPFAQMLRQWAAMDGVAFVDVGQMQAAV